MKKKKSLKKPRPIIKALPVRPVQCACCPNKPITVYFNF